MGVGVKMIWWRVALGPEPAEGRFNCRNEQPLGFQMSWHPGIIVWPLSTYSMLEVEGMQLSNCEAEQYLRYVTDQIGSVASGVWYMTLRAE